MDSFYQQIILILFNELNILLKVKMIMISMINIKLNLKLYVMFFIINKRIYK